MCLIDFRFLIIYLSHHFISLRHDFPELFFVGVWACLDYMLLSDVGHIDHLGRSALLPGMYWTGPQHTCPHRHVIDVGVVIVSARSDLRGYDMPDVAMVFI